MTLFLRFHSEEELQCRFALSPLIETATALRSLSRASASAYHLPWQRRARELLPGLGIEQILRISGMRGYQPDFYNPAPASPFTEIGAELDQVRATPPVQVAAELTLCLGPGWQDDDEWGSDPAAVRDLLADQLRRSWSALIEPWWPRLRDVLDADISYRARRLADAGIATALGELDPKVSVKDGTLTLARIGTDEINVSGAELVLVPSVFAWPDAPSVSFDPPAVCYPARGIHGLWQHSTRSQEDLVRLIGRTRAVLLTALTTSASTTGLAARTGTPVSSVSEHLSVLRANGLVSTTRTGRSLLHQRTALGSALVTDQAEI